MLPEPLVVVVKLARIFEALRIGYLVGGSMASSIYGIPRSTQDVDFVADIGPSSIAPLAAALAGEFYFDQDTIREAIAHRDSFNVIHLATMFKADIFPARADEWHESEMGRARHILLEGEDVVRFASPEDTLLHKLLWFKAGNEVSDRQWSDILGILRIQGKTLDDAYLERWSARLRVADLLSKARERAAG
jgi:hypothetical protein